MRTPYPLLETGPPSQLYSGVKPRGLNYRLNGWWEFYVRGENPDYPPRKRAFEYLWSRGVNVYKLPPGQIGNWTKWIEIRRQQADSPNPDFHPHFPLDYRLNHKLNDLRRSFPRTDGEWRIQKREQQQQKLNRVES